jgi:hypothetical protein
MAGFFLMLNDIRTPLMKAHSTNFPPGCKNSHRMVCFGYVYAYQRQVDMSDPKQRLKDLSEIGIVIDTWDDIFSDFDPSPMSDRTLSVDFIDEVKKRYRERSRKNVMLTVYAPESLASSTAEQIVIERIREYFSDRLRETKEDRAKEIRRGILFCAVGFFVLAAFGAIEHYTLFGPVLTEIFKWPIEVFGWFLMFEGFTFFAIPAKEFDKEKELNERLRDAEYRFAYIPGGNV